MKRARPEDAIQRVVFEHFRKRGMPGVYAFHPANGGKRGPIEGAIFKGLGVKAGTPDVIAIYRSHTYALELKAPKGKLKQTQIDAHNDLKLAGATVATSYGLKQAIQQLESWGLLRGKADFCNREGSDGRICMD